MVHDEISSEDATRFPRIVELPEAEVDEIAELSVNSMVGLSSSKTMKLKGTIAHQEVIIMIDYGATHKFISTNLVQKLRLPLEATTSYDVLMGTRLVVKGEGVFRRVHLTLQNIEIVKDFLPLNLESADIILGMQWLKSLGGMQINWKTLSMQLQVGGVTVLLQGDPTLGTSLVSLKAMWKALRETSEGLLVELGNIYLVELPGDSCTPPILGIVD